MKELYGRKVYKLSLSSGCTCPNRDGRIGTGGCTFCSEGGSGDFAAPFTSIDEQIRKARLLVDANIPSKIPSEERRYIAYFQSYTNTYGDTARLKSLYTETINRPEIVALSIGTRPDCLDKEKIGMLQELNRIKPVWVELGLQTIHDRTAERINRGYTLDVFTDAFQRLKAADLAVIVHVILGLPGETEEEMLETVRYLADCKPHPDGVKLQLLHVLKGTKLAAEYEEKPFRIFTLEEYCRLVVRCLQILPEDIVIHRITGDGPKRLLIAPIWSADKKKTLNALNKAIREADRKVFI